MYFIKINTSSRFCLIILCLIVSVSFKIVSVLFVVACLVFKNDAKVKKLRLFAYKKQALKIKTLPMSLTDSNSLFCYLSHLLVRKCKSYSYEERAKKSYALMNLLDIAIAFWWEIKLYCEGKSLPSVDLITRLLLSRFVTITNYWPQIFFGS